ncbi:MAG: hypothetical protein LLG04_02450 [Parachlamydia sp.]|nr:hypothetical protein [Parachlamydia sp.]
MKKIWAFFVIFLICVCGMRAYFRLTDDFRIANITYNLPYKPEWDAKPDQNLSTILQQPFSYIGKGSQSYAFSSADGRYVLKFFKYKHLRPHWLVEMLSPLPYFKDYQRKQLRRKARKLDHLFAGYHLAWESLRDESGLLFVHLNQTQGLYPKAIVIDKIGLKRTIDLDNVVFIVQRKAKTTRAVIDELLAKGDTSTAQLRIRQILQLYASEYQRGIYDMDHGVMHNTGFVGDKPIHLDIGKLTQDPRISDPNLYRPDIQKVGLRIAAWLEINHPEHRDAMLRDLDLALHELFGV